MKTQIAFVLLLLTLVTAVEAEAQVNHIYPPLETKAVNLGQGCRIKVDLPKGVEYGVHYETPIEKTESSGGRLWFNLMNPPPNLGEWYFVLFCYHISNYNASIPHMVLWDDKTKKWILNPSQDNAPFRLQEAHFKLFQIKTRTAQGWLATYDDINGEEKFRQRNLYICLFRNERAICSGRIEAGNLDDIRRQPHADRTIYILNFIKNIKFMEDAPPLLGSIELYQKSDRR
jgi:hypothetical protein